MFLLLFFLSADSLPPLPDLSEVIFPEPIMWVEKKETSFMLKGYGGNYYGGACGISLQNLHISAFYKSIHDWEQKKWGNAVASYSIALSHLWLKPSLSGFLLQKTDDYRRLSPGLAFSSTNSWSTIFGNADIDLWEINRKQHFEEKVKCNIILDQTLYLPHFEVTGVYVNEQFIPELGGQLHIRNLHLAVSSAIRHGFSSPGLRIKYLEPKIAIGVQVKSGDVYKTLKERFDPEMPLKYRSSVPEESLRVSAGLDLALDLYHHHISLRSSYNDWNNRIVTNSEFYMGTAQDVQEVNVTFSAKNNFTFEKLYLNNNLNINYSWTDTIIPFIAEYTLSDSLNIHYGFLYISLDAEYLSQRNGLAGRTLPYLLIINPAIGLQYKTCKIFASAFNITDQKQEKFDGYFLNNRQYAAGIEINYKF
jgi:hypothetical protein